MLDTKRNPLIVLPFSLADLDCASRLMGWIEFLCMRLPHRCLLVADCGVPPECRQAVLTDAGKVFESAAMICTPYKLPDESWPRGANWMFQTAAKHIILNHLGPWLWHEADCVPLRATFARELGIEYAESGRAFMGAKMDKHMAGIAVYPEDAWRRLKGIFNDLSRAWDVMQTNIVMQSFHETKRIQNFWGDGLGHAPTFVTTRTRSSPINALELKRIDPRAVLFHRNKDGTLIELLKRQLQ